MMDDWSMMDFCSVDTLPEVPGIYFLMNDVELVYVGHSQNIKKRVRAHHGQWNCVTFVGGEKVDVDSFDSIYYFECQYKPERKEYEQMFIEDYAPKLNAEDWRAYAMKVFTDLITKKNYVEGWRPDPHRFETYNNR